MKIFKVPGFRFVFCVSGCLQIHLSNSYMNKKNYLSMHCKDNLPSMELLSTDRSTDSNYRRFAISGTGLCAGIIQSITSLEQSESPQVSQCCFNINFCRAEKDSNPVYKKIFAPRIGMALKKEKNSLLFPFNSNRNENLQQECLTDLTSKRGSYHNYSRNPLRKRISISRSCRENRYHYWLLISEVRHAHNPNLYNYFWYF